MTETKFTPGPWEGCLHLRSNADETCGCGYRGGIWAKTTDVMVCEIGGPVGGEGDEMVPRSDRPTQIADHWLIAAAPDLYAALDGLNVIISGFTAERAADDAKIIEAQLAADTALAKARGETP